MATDLSKVRNIGIIAHIDAGKTTTTERILYYAGAERRMGDVDSGNTVTDWREDERERGITIVSAAVTLSWAGHRINLIDTPGHVDFTAEVERSLRVLDGAVFVFDAVAGVQAQSETVWRQSQKYHVPCIAFINKLDRVGADYERAVESIERRLKTNPVPLQWPHIVEGEILGIVDLVENEYLTWPLALDRDDQGRTVERGPIPGAVAEEAEAARTQMLDKLGDADDAFCDAYLTGEITAAQIRTAIRAATLAEAMVPVMCGTALRNKGVQRLMDAVTTYLPSPTDVQGGFVTGVSPKNEKQEKRKRGADDAFSALAFKTLATKNAVFTYIRVYSGSAKKGDQVLNASKGKKERLSQMWKLHADKREPVELIEAGDIIAVSGLQDTDTGDTLCNTGKPIRFEAIGFPHTVVQMSIEPRSSAGKDDLEQVLATMAREDPTFEVKIDPDSGQQLIAGMGELHLEVITGRMKDEFKVEARLGRPMVAYKETITGDASAGGSYARTTDKGAEIRADVRVRIEHDPLLPAVEVRNAATKEDLPLAFHDAVLQELKSALANGGDFGFPLVQARAILLGGTFYEGASNEMAFVAAASDAVRRAVSQTGTQILEPIMSLTVETPGEYVGDIQRDLNRRRVEITALDVEDDLTIIRGSVPIAEMFGYTTSIRSQSSGRATYSMLPLTYRPVPPQVAKRFEV